MRPARSRTVLILDEPTRLNVWATALALSSVMMGISLLIGSAFR